MSSINYRIARAVQDTDAPPIPKAKGWAGDYNKEAGPLLDLSQGVPGTPPNPALRKALADVAGTFEASKYGPILGEAALRDGMANELRIKYQLSDASLTAQDVGITTGCNMAFLTLLMVLCPPNESSVLLPLPSYFNHAMSLSMQSVVPEYIPCDPTRNFSPSLSAARDILLRSNDRSARVTPRAIMLVTPNNPTGAVYTAEEIREWYDLAREFKVALVLDETYRDFVDQPHRLFEDDYWRETLISLGSFSKGYRIPGYRLGTITASPTVLNHIATVLDCMQICPPRVAQLAITPLLPTLREDIQKGSLDLAAKRKLFVEEVESVPGWTVRSCGGYFAYVEFPDYSSPSASGRKVLGLEDSGMPGVVGSEAVSKALAQKCGVVTLPGSFFMPPTADEAVWKAMQPGAEDMRADRWIRFAVANVSEEEIRGLPPRLLLLNQLVTGTN